MEQGAPQGISNGEGLVPKSHVKEMEKCIRELERMLGKKTLENEILKEAVCLRQKKNLSRQPLPGLKR